MTVVVVVFADSVVFLARHGVEFLLAVVLENVLGDLLLRASCRLDFFVKSVDLRIGERARFLFFVLSACLRPVCLVLVRGGYFPGVSACVILGDLRGVEAASEEADEAVPKGRRPGVLDVLDRKSVV